MKRLAFTARWLLPLALWLAAVPQVLASSSYFSSMCAGCHDTSVAPTSSCNGCHAHGVHSSSSKSDMNLKGTTNLATYAPGATVSVVISGGYRTGWVRAILYDQNMKELARSTGASTMGGGAALPITLSAPAPTTAGTYTWNVAWYGNQYDTGSAAKGARWTPDPSNPEHGQEIVATNSFTVSAPTAPAIALSPASLAFGNVTTGATSTKTASIQNTGTGALTVTGVSRCSTPATSAEFTAAAGTLPLTVAPGSSATLSVTYAPTAAGADTGCIAVASNASNGATTNLSVTGAGVVPAAPKVAVSPASLAYGNVTVGAQSAKTFTVTNTGTAALTGTVARASGTSAEYAVSPATLNVAAGASQTVTVTYAPTDVSSDAGSVVVATNDAATPSVSVALAGAGVAAPAPAIALSPASLSFGNVTVGGSASLSAQIQNPGTASLTVSSIALCSGTSAEFSWSPGAPLTVAPGGSATVSVRYAPTAAGADTGCLAVASNDAAKPSLNLSVSGNGQAVAAPKVAVAPASLAFGNVTVGTSASKTFAVSNTGNAALTGTLTAGVGTSAEYAFSPSTLNVAAGASQTVTVTYAPAGVGADTGAILVATNDATTPSVNVALTGTGTAVPAPSISVSPATLSFGTVTLGSSGTLNATVRNTGSATLNVTGVAPCTGTTGEFTAPAAAFSVAPGASASLAVTYRPADVGADTGCLLLSSNDATSPSASLAVTGAGAEQPVPAIALAPASLDFGSVSVGAKATRTATVTNTGNAALQVSGVGACAGTSTEFQASPAGAFSVAAGASQTLTLTYAPTGDGADTGCFTVGSNDAKNPVANLAVQGSGAVPPPTTGVVDVDVQSFRVVGRVDDGRVRVVYPFLRAANAGTVAGKATATLVGVLNGGEIYRQSLPVELAPLATANLRFPRYAVPSGTRGSIAWTLKVEDADPDADVATATTWLGGYRGDRSDDLAISPVEADLVEGVDATTAGAADAATGSQGGGCASGAGGAGLVALALATAALVGSRFRRRSHR